MRYVLEKAEINSKNTGSRIPKLKWKEVASSNYVEMLIGIAGDSDRVIDIETGDIVYQTQFN